MISQTRKEYLKTYREKNGEALKEYARAYNKLYYINKKSGIQQTISLVKEGQERVYQKRERNTTVTERKCSQCQITMEISLFARNRTKPLGRDYQCNACTKKLKKWSKPDRYKYLARRKVGRAVHSGRLTRLPCQVCGDVKSEGHHDDYSKPLEVTWLCRIHHVDKHVQLRSENV